MIAATVITSYSIHYTKLYEAVACKYVHELSQKKNIKLPICNGLYRILNKELRPVEFIEEILQGIEI